VKEGPNVVQETAAQAYGFGP